ncbi:MAG: hypothetical protein HY057_06685 [Rhodospirillales bacterium]|nr:hypothetical protein [Rhodospirillales bacterium]
MFTRHRPVLLYESFSEWRDEARQILDGYGYVVFPANAPDGRFEAAVEFLALPRERADEFPQIAAAWSAEIERWRRMP